LVRDVVLRVAGKNDKAVRQLELIYGGGKTHTLITLLHLVTDPANLPNLPAVAEFIEAIGQPPPKARVRDYLAWEQVRTDLKDQEKDGNVDVARMQTLAINIDKAKGRIAEAIRQAYCIVVTVSEKDEVQAFKINVIDEQHFNIIKNDSRSRVQDSSITAEALLPDGPYNLWRAGETSRRVKDLSGAFAQLPHLPKMLKAQAILDTLTEGCAQGLFVLRLPRPDGSFRT
jgi:hypothetical protein